MKSIFVPIDLSDQSYEALEYALHLAKKIMAKKLVVFHSTLPVYNPEPGLSLVYVEDQDRIQEEIKEILEKRLGDGLQKSRLSEDSLITEVIVSIDTSPVSAIISQARKSIANLIVMGTHGGSGFMNLVFGSVTSGVIEDTDIPVLAVPKKYHFKDIGKITFATSLDHFKPELLAVIPFAKTLEAQIQVIHLSIEPNEEEKTDAAHQAIAQTQESVSLEVVNAQSEDVVEQLTQYVMANQPDCFVMFPHKMAWYEKIFNSSKTLDMLSKINVPLLVIQNWEKEPLPA